MSDAGHLITHVSDTARWTALYRATESARADALSSDPLGLKRLMNKKMGGMLQNAPFVFAPENGLTYFEDLGWRVIEYDYLMAAAKRFGRLPAFMWPALWGPQPNPRQPGRRPWSATALLTRKPGHGRLS